MQCINHAKQSISALSFLRPHIQPANSTGDVEITVAGSKYGGFRGISAALAGQVPWQSYSDRKTAVTMHLLFCSEVKVGRTPLSLRTIYRHI